MARKSRKENPVTGQKSKIDLPQKKFLVAGYVRLSNEQGEHPSSIETQKEMIQHFIDENTDMIFHRFYIDKGISSYANNKPAFDELINDVRDGVCNCIIVKDLSRFGRDYVETGKYVFSIFPHLGIRFIAITDHYDSIYSKMEDEYPLALRAIANHWYSTDISQKVKTVIHLKQRQGTFVLARAPFGYKKINSESGVMYEIDVVAAEIVLEIFSLRSSGNSHYQIAKKLNLRKLPSPNKYAGINEDGYWSVGTIRKILQNRFYTGDYVAGKSEHHLSGRFTKSIPQEEWTIIENHHPAIIDTATFNRLQPPEKSLSSKLKGLYHKNLPSSFDGKIYCGYCGRRMKKQGSRKNNDDKYYYLCPTYADSGGVRCQFNKIRADKLNKIIFDELQDQIKIAKEYQKKQAIFEASPTHRMWLEYRVNKIQNLKQEIENYKERTGRVTLERAMQNQQLTMLDFTGILHYEQSKTKYLEEKVEKIQAEIDNYIQNYSSKAEWVVRYVQCSDFADFDYKMLSKVVEQIRIYKSGIETDFYKGIKER